MATIRKIAQTAGVSPATVSRAINNHPAVAPAVRKRVLDVVNRTRYAAPVGKRSTTNIAFLYTGTNTLGSPFDAAILQGMSQRMDEFGFDLVVLSGARVLLPGETFTQMFLRKGIRGAVIRTDGRTRHLVRAIAEEGFCAVVVGDRFDDPKVSWIHCESRSTSSEAVSHLIAQGHRRIGICINRVDDTDHDDRLAGYREAMAAAGLEADQRLIFREDAVVTGGRQLLRKINASPARPTAMFIGDPLITVGALHEAQRLGVVVPRDLSIVGFDDGELRYVTSPQMTAVIQDAQEIGREAFEVLHRLIESPGSGAEKRTLRSRFEVNGSAAVPAHD